MDQTQDCGRTALREARELFGRLGVKTTLPHPSDTGPIRIVYPRRFPNNEFVIAVVIPIDGENIHEVSVLAKKRDEYHCSPAIINVESGRCLRLMWQIAGVRVKDEEVLLRHARELASQMKRTFPLREVIVCPIPGIVGLRFMLRASK